jgi:hypothetical protein
MPCSEILRRNHCSIPRYRDNRTPAAVRTWPEAILSSPRLGETARRSRQPGSATPCAVSGWDRPTEATPWERQRSSGWWTGATPWRGGRAPHLGEVDTAWSTEERYALRAQVLPAARHARKRRSACSASDRALTLHSSVDTHSMALGTTAMPSSCPSPSSRVRQHNRPTPGPGPEVPRKLHCRQAHRAQTSYAHARQAKQNCPGRVHARFRCHQHGHLGGGEASRSLK